MTDILQTLTLFVTLTIIFKIFLFYFVSPIFIVFALICLAIFILFLWACYQAKQDRKLIEQNVAKSNAEREILYKEHWKRVEEEMKRQAAMPPTPKKKRRKKNA